MQNIMMNQSEQAKATTKCYSETHKEEKKERQNKEEQQEKEEMDIQKHTQ